MISEMMSQLVFEAIFRLISSEIFISRRLRLLSLPFLYTSSTLVCQAGNQSINQSHTTNPERIDIDIRRQCYKYLSVGNGGGRLDLGSGVGVNRLIIQSLSVLVYLLSYSDFPARLADHWHGWLAGYVYTHWPAPLYLY